MRTHSFQVNFLITLEMVIDFPLLVCEKNEEKTSKIRLQDVSWVFEVVRLGCGDVVMCSCVVWVGSMSMRALVKPKK